MGSTGTTTYVSRPGQAPLRFTRRGRYAVLAGVAVLLVALVGSLVAIVRLVTDGGDCTVGTGDDAVSLSTRDAELAASAVARVIREGGDQAAARKAIRADVDLSPEDVVPVALALAGRSRAALSCTHGGGPGGSDDLVASGLTPLAEKVRLDLRTAWPGTPLGGFAPGGVSDGHMKGSAHYEGRAIDAFRRPITDNNRRLGWAMAQYYVAHADRLQIETVIFDARIWTARRADQGWRTYDVDTSGKPDDVAAILLHEDHVHVDVAD